MKSPACGTSPEAHLARKPAGSRSGITILLSYQRPLISAMSRRAAGFDSCHVDSSRLCRARVMPLRKRNSSRMRAGRCKSLLAEDPASLLPGTGGLVRKEYDCPARIMRGRLGSCGFGCSTMSCRTMMSVKRVPERRRTGSPIQIFSAPMKMPL